MKTYIIILLGLFFTSGIFAEGLMIPGDSNYPDDFLKNISTEVTVNIYGNMAETRVLQEFKNEWYDTISGTYSFPLPINARTTRLLYSRGDTMVDAVLKVQQQDVNPGTGEGGTASLVNEYMGNNVIRISISDIRPQSSQKVELHYISELRSGNGTYSYNYPLNTEDFVDYPLEYFKLNLNLLSSLDIVDFNMGDLTDYSIISENDSVIRLECIKNKIYPKTDIHMNYSVDNSDITMQFFSTKPDSSDGYFTSIIQPQIEEYATEDKNIVFVLEASTSLSGKVFDQSKLAIKKAISQLLPTDNFNVIIYNSSYSVFNTSLITATESNINAAIEFINDANLSYGNRLDIAISQSMYLLNTEVGNNSIVVFSRGYNYLDLNNITESNTNNTGIFSVSFGKDVEKTWLESMCRLNYGFSTFYDEDEDITENIIHLMQVINTPVYNDLQVEFKNPTVYSVYPETNTKLYNGHDLVITGRYSTADTSDILIFDKGSVYDSITFEVVYEDENKLDMIEKLWAKMAIDKLETIIMTEGENDSIKEELIGLSLKHNIRCRYTAYVATYTTNETPVETDVSDPGKDSDEWDISGDIVMTEENIFEGPEYSITVFPNPASDILFIKLNNEMSKPLFLIIYDVSGKILTKIKLGAINETDLLSINLKSLIPEYKGLIYLNIEGEGYKSKIEKVLIL